MRGDFSKWPVDVIANAVGPLHQQGRVLLDTDINALTAINARWQDEAARAAFGADVAAISTEQPASYQVSKAVPTGTAGAVTLTVHTGEAWADGLRVELRATSGDTVTRTATYLGAVPNDPEGANTRDAVVLEVWRETLSAFQRSKLLEPALGGPDTSERLITAQAFRLWRMGAGDTCETVASKVKDDRSKHGKLTVALAPEQQTPGDCPMDDAGGYTGLEHNLYRVEIVPRANGAQPTQFKYSRYNGGLVGRGRFDNSTAKHFVTLTANDQAILRSALLATANGPGGPASLYLETQEHDAALGHWVTGYTATAKLGDDNTLTLTNESGGAFPSAGSDHFFRLWDDLRDLSDFPSGTPTTLIDGIQLAFESAASSYVGGDFWTFAVRAGGIANQSSLLDHAAPEGPAVHRVPLAELDWGNSPPGTLTIFDCREKFDPLTKLSSCCTYTVGDGQTSHGDYTSIQQAIDDLPKDGGRVCVLPGQYAESVTIDKPNVILTGCGGQTRLTGKPAAQGQLAAAVSVVDTYNTRVEDLTIFADPAGVGVLLDYNGAETPRGRARLRGLQVLAQKQPAIETRSAVDIEIRDCRVAMKDTESSWAGMLIEGQRILIENNLVIAPSARVTALDQIFSPASVTGTTDALGGIWLRGRCADVRVIDNWIEGGRGHGITLGDVEEIDAKGKIVLTRIDAHFGRAFDRCQPNGPGIPQHPQQTPPGGTVLRASGPLRNIWIERNRIEEMGASGVAALGFFAADGDQGIISVEGLVILGNQILGCLRRPTADLEQAVIGRMAFGAIAIADVEDFICRDNLIEGNGADWHQPICGIYVFHGMAIEISRNRILGNGARGQTGAEGAKAGMRGGIVVQLATVLPAIDPVDDVVVRSNGQPALKVHENIVVAPMGQALFAFTLGPVSVVGNQLTSQGMGPGVYSRLATTVVLLDLGVSPELAGEFLGFEGVATGASTVSFASDHERGTSLLDINGNVKFEANQVALDLTPGALLATSVGAAPQQTEAIYNGASRGTGDLLSLSSIMILSLDDVGFVGNQCDCAPMRGFLLTNAFLLAPSVRLTANRLKEFVFSAFYSAITLGLMNNASDNESTHCLWILGAHTYKAPSNLELINFAGARRVCQAPTGTTTKTGFFLAVPRSKANVRI